MESSSAFNKVSAGECDPRSHVSCNTSETLGKCDQMSKSMWSMCASVRRWASRRSMSASANRSWFKASQPTPAPVSSRKAARIPRMSARGFNMASIPRNYSVQRRYVQKHCAEFAHVEVEHASLFHEEANVYQIGRHRRRGHAGGTICRVWKRW